MFRIKALVALGGFMLLYFAWQELQLAGLSSPTPTKMTLEELATSGPGENANLELSDFLVCVGDYVYQSKREEGPWSDAWVPVVPLGGEYHQVITQIWEEVEGTEEEPVFPAPEEIHVIFKFTDSPSESKIEVAAELDVIQGLVINEIESLDRETMSILASSYPGSNIDDLYIVEIGRMPKDTSTIYLMLAAGVALLIAGIWLLIGKKIKSKKPTNPDHRSRAELQED